ncbi:hypothetical protein RSW80_26245, partial [Escherichia coli]|uniref:hypothetical protein n=1 Tax=Escherichia coli TaxID=562 RepID=UPI0028E06774
MSERMSGVERRSTSLSAQATTARGKCPSDICRAASQMLPATHTLIPLADSTGAPSSLTSR